MENKIKYENLTIEEIASQFKDNHPVDIAEVLLKIKKEDNEKFNQLLNEIPEEQLGEVILEFPEHIKDQTYKQLSIEKLTSSLEELETDDATDIIQDIEEFDKNKAKNILNNLDEEEKKEIEWLKRYEEDEAGAFMQTELFKANINEKIKDSISRFKKLKAEGELENIHQVFIVDDEDTLIATIALEDLIILDFNKTFKEILEKIDINEKYKPFKVSADTDIQEVLRLFEDYDLNVVAVVGYKDRLIGRITSDDILDVASKSATEQMYQLAGVDDEYEHEEDLVKTSKNRAIWLFINLLTAILASAVIGIFDEEISKYVALAVLMPIVASMGGNAGTQTLSVMVRQIALGEIEDENQKDAIKKEIFISVFNGVLFAIVMGLIAFLWFKNIMLGVVIALAMIITLFCAGFFGSLIPLLLKKFDIDPAVGSSVLLTTVTDVMGFFSFLGLAKIFLIK